MVEQRHKVLILGAGLMTVTVVDVMLSKYSDTDMTIGSRTLKSAEEIADKFPGRATAEEIDIFDAEKLSEAVSRHDLIISYIPPFHHMEVIRACLKNGKNMVTSSYISAAMTETHDEWVAKGLICLNECGLDPGIDIMSTIKIRDEARKEGVKIVGYESWCGALAAAEHTDNPLGYKFSWAPGAAIKASKNEATYRKDGKTKVVASPLKDVQVQEDFSVSLKLESYPNRDSLVFLERFEMQDCETFIRGTLRFKGFSWIVASFHDAGLTSEMPVPAQIRTLQDLLDLLLAPVDPAHASPDAHAAVAKVLVGASPAQADLALRYLTKIDLAHVAVPLEAMLVILKGLKFLDFFHAHSVPLQPFDKDANPRFFLQVFGDHLAQKLKLQDTDRDLVFMRHVFTMEDQNLQRWQKTSTLIGVGPAKSENGYSYVAQTVGFTTAYAARLILDNQISLRGVLSPIYPEIYNPVLDLLEKNHGIRCVEEDARM